MTDTVSEVVRQTADVIAARYAAYSQVEAVALGGSLSSGMADAQSDIDLYVYVSAELPMTARAEIAWESASYAEVGNEYWEPGDEWVQEQSGVHVDVMFRTQPWIEDQLARVLTRFEGSVGCSTCLWHNVLTSIALFDRDGWYAKLRQDAAQPYPLRLRQAIVVKNHPILRETASSYRYQIERAVRRDDWVAVNHRVAAVLASYFDILFAVNGVSNPGQKQLVRWALALCEKTPPEMESQVGALLVAVAGDTAVADRVNDLVDGLDALLGTEGVLRP